MLIIQTIAAIGLQGAVLAGNPSGAPPSGDPPDRYAGPQEVSLLAVVRKFEPAGQPGGHPDFGPAPAAGRGHYVGLVEPELDGANRPVLASTGYLCRYQAEDAGGRAVAPVQDHIENRPGDLAAETDSLEGGAVRDAASFAQWFRDVPSTNRSAATSLTLIRSGDAYLFDDRLESGFARRGGFFVAGPDLFADADGRNNHFTCELTGAFEHDGGGYLELSADDDAWVFIDGKLVIDLGGVHGRLSQRIDLDRLSWLEDGERYELRIFLAERGGPSSLRIETDLAIEAVLPAVAEAD